MDTLIIKACLNGARSADGGISYDPLWCARSDHLIRSRSDPIINHTTARMPNTDLTPVLRYLRETPEPVDMMSLDTGTIVINRALQDGTRSTLAIPNSY